MHQWICLDELYKLIDSFFYKFIFELLAENQKIFI